MTVGYPRLDEIVTTHDCVIDRPHDDDPGKRHPCAVVAVAALLAFVLFVGAVLVAVM